MSKVESALCGFKERHSLEYKRSIVVTLLCIGRFAELPRELFHLILSHALDALHTAPACGVYGVRWREIEALPEGDRCTFAGVEPCKVAQELALMHHALFCSIELCEFILWEREQPQGNSSEEERLEFFSRERSPLRRSIAAFRSVRICVNMQLECGGGSISHEWYMQLERWVEETTRGDESNEQAMRNYIKWVQVVVVRHAAVNICEL